ncbi:MAG: hypothetical protein P1U40_07645 [Coxiellaceae bacterium]|nr:hypothetical protein [Coxiellaceae bacterium]
MRSTFNQLHETASMALTFIFLPLCRLMSADSYFIDDDSIIEDRGLTPSLINKVGLNVIAPVLLSYAAAYAATKIYQRTHHQPTSTDGASHRSASPTVVSPNPAYRAGETKSTAPGNATPPARRSLLPLQTRHAKYRIQRAAIATTLSTTMSLTPLILKEALTNPNPTTIETSEKWLALVPFIIIPILGLSDGITAVINHNHPDIDLGWKHLITAAAILAKLGPLMVLKTIKIIAPQALKSLSESLSPAGMILFSAAVPLVLGSTKVVNIAHAIHNKPMFRNNINLIATLASVNFLADFLYSAAPHLTHWHRGDEQAHDLSQLTFTTSTQVGLTIAATTVGLLAYKLVNCISDTCRSTTPAATRSARVEEMKDDASPGPLV